MATKNIIMKLILKKSIISLGVVMACTMSSCVIDPYDQVKEPGKATLIITTQWDGRSGEAELPPSYFNHVNDDPHEVSGIDNAYKLNMPPGTHQLHVHNRPSGYEINDFTAKLSALDSRFSDPRPGYLYAATKPFECNADEIVNVVANMNQITRRLNIDIEAQIGNYGGITEAYATFEGVSGTINLKSESRGEDPRMVTLPLEFDPETSHYTTWFRLPGLVATTPRRLHVDLVFESGYEKRITTDCEKMLASFNFGVEPMTVHGELMIPTGDISGAIINWEVTNGGEYDAE